MTAPTFAAWTAWLAFLGPEEGTLSLDPTDTGNWTGGAVGRGTLVGTKYGISAASYPTLEHRGADARSGQRDPADRLLG